MAKKELFSNPLAAKLLKGLGAFPVDRGKPDLSAIRTAVNLLQEGKICGVFPEGTRQNQHIGESLPPKSGAAFLAYKANVKVLPVYVSQNHRPFSTINIVVGKPFNITKQDNIENNGNGNGNGNGVALKESAQYIMNTIYSLKENIV